MIYQRSGRRHQLLRLFLAALLCPLLLQRCSSKGMSVYLESRSLYNVTFYSHGYC